MRNWKNWLFPLLTCLLAVGLAILPLWLSVREDGQISGIVHSEALPEDSNFPAKVPELPGRIRLLAQREAIPDTLTIMEYELDGAALDEAAALARNELERLAEAGVFPPEAIGTLEEFSAYRLYLRDQSDLSSASFLEMTTYNPDLMVFLCLYLDGETGKLLSLTLGEYPMMKYPASALDIGRIFLDGLGAPYAEMDGEDRFLAMFRLTDNETLYRVVKFDMGLHIYPDVDWEFLDEEAKGKSSSVSAAMDG